MSLVSILEKINGHEDLLRLNEEERTALCQEIREFLIDRVSKTGGHLASNLGTVELSVALETVYDTKVDRLVFDVGHQSYVHKILTGRQADFDNLRQFGGMAGFPKPSESITDAFVAGHASSSVSIALGMARARSLSASDYHVVAVIGDGAALGGEGEILSGTGITGVSHDLRHTLCGDGIRNFGCGHGSRSFGADCGALRLCVVRLHGRRAAADEENCYYQ